MYKNLTVLVLLVAALFFTACGANQTHEELNAAFEDFEYDPDNELSEEQQRELWESMICETAYQESKDNLENWVDDLAQTFADGPAGPLEGGVIDVEVLEPEDAATWYDDKCGGVPRFDDMFAELLREIINDGLTLDEELAAIEAEAEANDQAWELYKAELATCDVIEDYDQYQACLDSVPVPE